MKHLWKRRIAAIVTAAMIAAEVPGAVTLQVNAQEEVLAREAVDESAVSDNDIEMSADGDKEQESLDDSSVSNNIEISADEDEGQENPDDSDVSDNDIGTLTDESGEQEIFDGGFENGNLNGWQNDDPQKFVVSPEEVYEGEYALKIYSATQDWSCIKYTMPVDTNYMYRLSFYAKGSATTYFKVINKGMSAELSLP